MKRVAWKLLRALFWVLLGSVLLYLVGMNVFVRTRLFRDLIGEDPASLVVDYTGAYSIIPGRIHVENLRIRGRDSNVEWILTIDRCDFDVSFTELAHKKFHASHVDGDGLSLRVRQRQPSFTSDEAASLPPVPGFSDPPYSGVPPPPLTDASYNLWGIDLESVDANHVREIWIDTTRYTGDLEIHGRWRFRPMRWLEVGPAMIDARTLEVSRGIGEAWVERGTGSLVATIHPFDLRAVHGADMLDPISVVGDLQGTAELPAISERALAGHATITRGEVPVQAHLDLDHGVMRPGTHVHAERFDAAGHAVDLDFAGSFEADVRVDDDGVGHARVDARGLEASQAAFPRARVEDVVGALQSRDLDLAHPFSDAAYVVDVKGARTNSLRYWWSRAGLAPRVALDSGPATATGHVEGTVRGEHARGSFLADVHDLRAQSGSLGMSLSDLTLGVARATVDRPYGEGARSKRTIELDGASASALGVELRANDDPRAGVAVPRLEVTTNGLKVLPAGVLGHVIADAPVIDVPSLTALAKLVKLPPELGLDGPAAHGTAKVDVDLGQGTAGGGARFVAPGVRVRTGKQVLEGNLVATVMAKPSSAGAVTVLSGSTVEFREARQDGWWATVRLPAAQVSMEGGARFRAQVTMQAKDASPVTSVVDQLVSGIAELALNAVPTGGLDAGGEIVLGPSTIEARSVWARADGFDLHAELADMAKQTDCALLLKVGVVQAGVELGTGKTGVYLFGAEPWFAARSASMRAAERRVE